MIANLLLQAWERRGPLAVLLLPVSWVYGLVVALRRGLYRSAILKAAQLPCTVLVVGNAVVGGAGKTPTTIGIVRHLRARGLQVGVVSRGYGGSARNPCAVTPATAVQVAGDEPLLIARATGVPVFVSTRRHLAASALLAAHPQTQVIVCDDGLQHYPLYRDMEVCVFDARGAGNGWLLPSGPLREPWPRRALACVGQSDARLLVLHTGATAAFAGFRAQRSLAPHALTQDGRALPLSGLQGPLLALAGIAQPAAFFASLRDAGLALARTVALPDHFDFSRLDTGTLKGYQVLCTEKDAVKLWQYWPEALAVPLVQNLEPAFLQALDAMVDGIVAAKLSSGHGHQTA